MTDDFEATAVGEPAGPVGYLPYQAEYPSSYPTMINYVLPSLARAKTLPATFQHPRRAKIDEVVLHDSDSKPGRTFDEFSRYTAAPTDGRQVSIHYMVDRNGRIVTSVPEGNTANHVKAGGHNERSVGIELFRRQNDSPDFTTPQYEAVSQLSYYLMRKYGIGERNIIGHGDVQRNRSGEPHGFDWNLFQDLLRSYDSKARILTGTGILTP